MPVLFTRSDRPFALALKSGNFGTPEFFAKALRMLADDINETSIELTRLICKIARTTGNWTATAPSGN